MLCRRPYYRSLGLVLDGGSPSVGPQRQNDGIATEVPSLTKSVNVRCEGTPPEGGLVRVSFRFRTA